MEDTMYVTGDVHVITHIMMNELKTGISNVMVEVIHIACNQVIHNNNTMIFRHKTVNKMRTNESSTTRNQDAQIDVPLCSLFVLRREFTTVNEVQICLF
jgi:hypothetical protein